MEVEIGDLVLLRSKNKSNTRCPKGTIVDTIIDRNLSDVLVLKLTEDYIGKNETWFSGEEKGFKYSEIQKVCKL